MRPIVDRGRLRATPCRGHGNNTIVSELFVMSVDSIELKGVENTACPTWDPPYGMIDRYGGKYQE